MAISGGGAASGAMSGAAMGAMFGPVGMGVGAGVGGLIGLFSGASLSKEEKAILQQLDIMSKQQQGYAGDLMARGKAAPAKYGAMAKNVRNAPGLQQAMGYHSAIVGGDRAKMQSATTGARTAMADTYRGGRQAIEAGGMRAPQKAKAQAEMDRQETGQLAGLVQGQQGASADALGSMELNVQQLMQQYLGLGEQTGIQNAYAAGGMMGQAGNNYQTMLGAHQGVRQQNAATQQAMGQAAGSMMGYGMDAWGGGTQKPVMKNQMTNASRPTGNWASPQTPLSYGGATGGGGNYFNASGGGGSPFRSNPWAGVFR